VSSLQGDLSTGSSGESDSNNKRGGRQYSPKTSPLRGMHVNAQVSSFELEDSNSVSNEDEVSSLQGDLSTGSSGESDRNNKRERRQSSIKTSPLRGRGMHVNAQEKPLLRARQEEEPKTKSPSVLHPDETITKKNDSEPDSSVVTPSILRDQHGGAPLSESDSGQKSAAIESPPVKHDAQVHSDEADVASAELDEAALRAQMVNWVEQKAKADEAKAKLKERERAEQERAETERAEKERAGKELSEQELSEQERAVQGRVEQERVEQDRAEANNGNEENNSPSRTKKSTGGASQVPKKAPKNETTKQKPQKRKSSRADRTAAIAAKKQKDDDAKTETFLFQCQVEYNELFPLEAERPEHIVSTCVSRVVLLCHHI
jgi:hypothetical protein